MTNDSFLSFKQTIPLSNQSKEVSDYITDLWQRSVLFLDVMRKRGNDMLEITSKNLSTVLNFKFEIIMDGVEFEQPINYWLARVIAPEGVTTEFTKRPYVIQDPRAGQGPGIGGFKNDSEIGDALKHGHPVYFIGFNAKPIEGQTFEDIIRGQTKFYEAVAELHPNSPKMCAIGNCAAGYLTMFSAMQRPNIFGPILIAGSPLSYWNGERGRNPMRYKGGLVGGSWINSLLGDIGNGKFDGHNLVLNFDLLNISNFLWGKQYSLYANIDQDAQRYLQFEKWWGDFIQFNTAEIKWLVDKLFVGNQLTTGQLTTDDGIKLDPRLITSPIITFVSSEDNISPPAQSAGWIADLYSDVDEIRARGKTIVYCLNHKVGHLAIFTATKVGKREDEMFVENMETLDMLPPGLYELILETPEGEELVAGLSSRYEPRTIEDIKKLGYNNEDDDRTFATVTKASQAFDLAYNTFMSPLIKQSVNQKSADYMRMMNPLRLGYTLFADKYNPLMKFISSWTQNVLENRKPVDSTNNFWEFQQNYSQLIYKTLTNWQIQQDKMQEQLFFNIWGNKAVQKFWGMDKAQPRYTPSTTKLEREYLLQQMKEQTKEHLVVKNEVEALYRVVALVQRERHVMSEKMAEVLNEQTQHYAIDLDRAKIREIIKSQFMVVAYDHDVAVSELKKYLMQHDGRNQMLEIAHETIKKIGGAMPADTRQILMNLAKELALAPAL